MTAPYDLRVEHLDEPFGIMMRTPRLSWKLPFGSDAQVAYQLQTSNGWDSGRVESSDSILVPYAGPALRSGERVSWTVKVWTGRGESGWAESASWEMGLLEAWDWVAQWIAPAEDEAVRAVSPRPGYRLGRDFTTHMSIVRARLYVTAHGLYEFFVNGDRVGDAELTPGYTSYASRLQVQTFDVTDLLIAGSNVLHAELSDGWFRGQNGVYRTENIYGDTVALLAQLHIEGDDGSCMKIGTDEHWTAAPVVIIDADLMEGQTVDLRREALDPSSLRRELSNWLPVIVRDDDIANLCSSPAPPVRTIEKLRPVATTKLGAGRQVFEFDSNITGWVRLANTGPAGTELLLTYGESTDELGDVTLANIPDRVTRDRFQLDKVTSAGEGVACFEPRHTTHGFQYVRIEGHPDEIDLGDVQGMFVHSDMRRTGWFECSDERINRLHEAAVLSFRANACDIPTDCPTRERAGWTGDWQIFLPSAAFVYDVAGFSIKWLRDLAAEQLADGTVLHCAPNPYDVEMFKEYGAPHGSAGWGDAAVIVPWELYATYGDAQLLEEQWPSMKAWVDYAVGCARRWRHPSRVAARAMPAPHEEFIWDSGFHFGEWGEPGHETDLAALAAADHGELATAYLYRSSSLLSAIAHVIGRGQDAAYYRDFAAAVRAAWQAEFVSSGGSLTSQSQASHVRALAFNLVSEKLRPVVAQQLVNLIEKADTHVGTGFLSTPDVLPALADTGHLETAYALLFQDTEPSWLTMIDRGSSTIWERWNGIEEDGVAGGSLNHYAKGSVINFLHRYVAGIRPIPDEPAYRRFVVAPLPGGHITQARGMYDCPYGRIESSWSIAGNEFTLDVTVPSGTRASVMLPDGQRFTALPGMSRYRCVDYRKISPIRIWDCQFSALAHFRW